jgi:hypothetical protein
MYTHLIHRLVMCIASFDKFSLLSHLLTISNSYSFGRREHELREDEPVLWDLTDDESMNPLKSAYL